MVPGWLRRSSGSCSCDSGLLMIAWRLLFVAPWCRGRLPDTGVSQRQPPACHPHLVAAVGLLADDLQVAAAGARAAAGAAARTVAHGTELALPVGIVGQPGPRSARESPAAWRGSPERSRASQPARRRPAMPAGAASRLGVQRGATPHRARSPEPARARVRAARRGRSRPERARRPRRSPPAGAGHSPRCPWRGRR